MFLDELKVKNQRKKIFLIIGIFLLIYSTNAYFLFGNIGKMIVLFAGFIFVVWNGLRIKSSDRPIIFFLLSFFFYFIYLWLAFKNNQNTTGFLNVSFSLVCFSFLNIGFIIGDSKSFDVTLKDSYKIIFSVLTIFGALVFYLGQVTNILSYTYRDLGDENLNPIGVAYVHSLLFVFLFWMLQSHTKFLAKIIIYCGLMSTIFVIISAQSRGAIIYLLVFLILFYIRSLIFDIRKLIYAIVGIAFFVLIFLLLIDSNQYIQEKYLGLSIRFESLINFSSEYTSDASVAARELIIGGFLEDIGGFFYGQPNYIPYPHNQFVEIFMRWGVFGIPLFIFSIVNFIYGLLLLNKKFLNARPIFFLIYSLFFFSYLQSMSSMSLEMNRFLWLGFGLLAGYKEKV